MMNIIKPWYIYRPSQIIRRILTQSRSGGPWRAPYPAPLGRDTDGRHGQGPGAIALGGGHL
jgi:hypothetical protein